MTFHCDWPKGQLKTSQSAEPLLIDAVQEAMGPVVSTLGKEIDKKIKALEEDTNKMFETLEHEIRSISNLQRHQLQSIDAQQSTDKPVNAGVDTQESIQEPAVAGVEALKDWSRKSMATIVYDSTVDEFTNGCLFQTVRGKENIAIVATTTDGDVFGGFYSVTVTEQWEDYFDPNIFAFSFESHRRCTTPQRFAVKEELTEKANVWFGKSDNIGFVFFKVEGVGWFYLGNERSDSFCSHLSHAIEGLEDTTLTGKNNTGGWREGPYHHCARLVAIQLV